MKKVLIVEDEPWQADIFARQLRDYTVAIVDNGYAAIAQIDEELPDVIVLDMLLGGSNGVTLIHELKSHDDLATIPIILVTNLADALPEQLMKQYGIADMLDKTTIGHGAITRAVEKVLA